MISHRGELTKLRRPIHGIKIKMAAVLSLWRFVIAFLAAPGQLLRHVCKNVTHHGQRRDALAKIFPIHLI
jgi:hypothetical protein